MMTYQLKLDYFDNTQFIRLTRENIDLVSFACKTVDSHYRNIFDPHNVQSFVGLIKQYKADNGDAWVNDRNLVESVCKAIDKEDRTHLSVSGIVASPVKGSANPNAQGINLMVDYIMKHQAILDKIKRGEPSVVNDMAESVKGPTKKQVNQTFSKFSFASKFCTYVARYYWNSDDAYAIYDDVVQSILPYYIYKYVDKDTAKLYMHGKKSSVNDFQKTNDYEGYNKLITCTIEGAKAKEQCKMTKEEFDLLIWYYYRREKKGLIPQALNSIEADC